MENSAPKILVSEIFNASLKAVNPYESAKPYIDRIYSIYQNDNYNKLFVIGFGKAVCSMAKAAEDSLASLINAGIVITKYGHCYLPFKPEKIEVCEAGHPVPDASGLKAAKKIIRLVSDTDERTFIVCLISGGGSALLVSPYEGVSLGEKQKITELLLKAGANINELNTVRKHISRVKGGRLAELAYPAKVISLILSDVIGDRLDVIASGPTSPDKTTYGEALRILEKYGLMDGCPQSILEVLYKGAKGLIPETPKEGNIVFERVENIIIGSNKKALSAAKEKAEGSGFYAEIISSELTGEARDAGKWLAKKAIRTRDALSVKRNARICLISGGETTVTVKGNGVGGRNMELALSFAMEIEGIDGIILLSAGTDGTNGPTDAAGAIIDGYTVKKAKAIGLNPKKYLNNNDSYNFFKKIDGLFITGPTGTNVMDIQIILVGSQ
ncbi:MAG: glycerate kinase [Thermodesulfovibrionales bacterium]|nr:glycerate kinase [Thermodesulfovibrionales bacterium]